jgi:putative SOS response-associated peptidase YedK
MCGRFTLKTPAGAIVSEFNLRRLDVELRPRFNIAPSQDVLVVLLDGDGSPRGTHFRWGLVPFWAKDPRIGNRLINARAETVHEKPAFRAAFARRRCLVIADGFYEWQKHAGGKRPFRIQRRDGRAFAFAGIWEEWGSRAAPLRSCAILTTSPNELMWPIHDRMPVVLPPEAYHLWIDGNRSGDECAALLSPCPDTELEAFEVSTLVNSPANDRPECIERVRSNPDLLHEV